MLIGWGNWGGGHVPSMLPREGYGIGKGHLITLIIVTVLNVLLPRGLVRAAGQARWHGCRILLAFCIQAVGVKPILLLGQRTHKMSDNTA